MTQAEKKLLHIWFNLTSIENDLNDVVKLIPYGGMADSVLRAAEDVHSKLREAKRSVQYLERIRQEAEK